MSPPPPLLPASKRRRLRSRASKRRLWERTRCQFFGWGGVDEKVQSSKGVLSSEGRLRSEGVLLSSEGVQIAEGPAPAENEPLRVLASWSRRTRCSRRSRRT